MLQQQHLLVTTRLGLMVRNLSCFVSVDLEFCPSHQVTTTNTNTAAAATTTGESFHPPRIPGRNRWKKKDQDDDNSWNNNQVVYKPQKNYTYTRTCWGRALLQQENYDNNNDKDHEVQVVVLGYFLALVLCCGSSVSLSSSWCRRHSRRCPTAVPRTNTTDTMERETTSMWTLCLVPGDTRNQECHHTSLRGRQDKRLSCEHGCQTLGTGRDSPLSITGWLVFWFDKSSTGG